MERKSFALYTLLVGALVGVIGDVLFYGKVVGISFPLFFAIAIIVVLASQSLMRQPIRLRNLWVLIPALFFAAMVGVRADGGINGLNIFAALALGALALHYLPLSERIDLAGFGEQVLGVLDATFGSVVAPLYELIDSASWGFSRLQGNWRIIASVGRGLLISAPVVLVFGLLLASADAVFAGYVDQIVGLFSFRFFSEQMYQIGFVGVVGWMACGGLAYGVARREALQHRARADKPKRKRLELGMIEGCMALASVDLLFALFVIIQFAYFFGGQASLSVTGMTYSEYARRGFFELVAVSVLTLGLVLALDSMTIRRASRHTLIFRVLAVLLVALTGVLLVSASQRMLLYEDQYGFTTLRVYTHVFMLWLGVLFVVFLLALFRLRTRVFSLGVLLVMIGYLGTLNLMNVEGYIAQRNVARAAERREIDFSYLNGFSADAVPAILDLYHTTNSLTLEDSAGQWLSGMLIRLDTMRATSGATVFSANWSRDRAWVLLDEMRGELPEYVPGWFYQEYSRSAD